AHCQYVHRKTALTETGIGGLTAALGLRQQGHTVTLFERTGLATETGAAIHIAPNCHGILRRFGVFPEAFGANPVLGITEYGPDEHLKFDLDMRKPNSIWQHPWVLAHRVGLHEELKKQATSTAASGTPAVLHKSSRVVDVDCANATVTLEDGTRMQGDLVIGADGVSSVTRKLVAGDEIKPFGSGKSAFRFMIPRDQILESQNLKNVVKRDGYMTMWIGNDRRIIMYPCSDNTLMNFVAIHPSSLSAAKEEGWNRTGSKTNLIEIFESFGPTVKALLGMVDEASLKVWTLLDMERIPRWFNERLVLLGDAAHPFLPRGIAIEDAAALCALLPVDTPRHEIPDRLALYAQLRDERAHKIQHFTRLAGADLDDALRSKFNIMEFTNYNFGHDEWHNATQALKKHLWSRNGAIRWRSPTAWGPCPSPRQDHYGRQISAQGSRFTTYTVKFKTSATLLRTLFPTEAFSFVSPGTVAEASFKCTQLAGMKWLGGGGYHFFGIWIHGVQYQKKDGTHELGTFLPVLLENSPDAIITGRAELGMPKLFCDIAVTEDLDSRRIVCSWRGSKFVDIKMTGLQGLPAAEGRTNGHHAAPGEDTNSSNGPIKEANASGGNNILTYRSVPSVGVPGACDAEYAVVIDAEESRVPTSIEKTLKGTKASMSFSENDWETLPTLHHIASGFAEIPVYDIVDVRVEEGQGIDDLAQARRIE
ncbi:uncharacterized protein F5Z01DRAFT_697552, partial [Emericellopsis atlantica]